MEIILDEDDDPQLIFESINSTGMYLETSDLIRNFLLMGIRDPGKQKEYHNKTYKNNYKKGNNYYYYNNNKNFNKNRFSLNAV